MLVKCENCNVKIDIAGKRGRKISDFKCVLCGGRFQALRHVTLNYYGMDACLQRYRVGSTFWANDPFKKGFVMLLSPNNIVKNGSKYFLIDTNE